MRELAFNEYCSVSGGEVGATKMGDDVSYTGVYPHCAIAGELATVFATLAQEAMGKPGSAVAESLNFVQVARDQVVHNCIRTHGNPTPSLPPAAGGGGGLQGALPLDYGSMLKVKDLVKDFY
jgi:hypothetical protein